MSLNLIQAMRRMNPLRMRQHVSKHTQIVVLPLMTLMAGHRFSCPFCFLRFSQEPVAMRETRLARLKRGQELQVPKSFDVFVHLSHVRIRG